MPAERGASSALSAARADGTSKRRLLSPGSSSSPWRADSGARAGAAEWPAAPFPELTADAAGTLAPALRPLSSRAPRFATRGAAPAALA